MTSFAVRYDVICHPSPINSQYLNTSGVDSPGVTEERIFGILRYVDITAFAQISSTAFEIEAFSFYTQNTNKVLCGKL